MPSQCVPQDAVTLREETASLLHSLEKEIDQFHPEEVEEEQREPVIPVSDSEEELDKSSGIHTSRFIVARVGDNSKKEEEMSFQRKGLRDLLKGRN